MCWLIPLPLTMRSACAILYTQISPEGIALRDEKVFRFAREKNIPIVMLTSGLRLFPSVSYGGCFGRFCAKETYLTRTYSNITNFL